MEVFAWAVGEPSNTLLLAELVTSPRHLYDGLTGAALVEALRTIAIEIRTNLVGGLVVNDDMSDAVTYEPLSANPEAAQIAERYDGPDPYCPWMV